LTFKSTSTFILRDVMKIKDIADRSGFSPPTLRYYEEIGLLPAPTRTPSGYRTYDEGTLERLAFIARAKQLGCTLEEIAGLATAWDGGRCGPVQDRLRGLVADKLAAAHEHIVELSTLLGELRRAAEALERHRPDGPCDDECGCVTDTDAPPALAVDRTTNPSASPTPIACTLRPDGLRGRLEDWHGLLDIATRRCALDDGVRIEFADGAPLDRLTQLVAAERDCCQFLRFAITVDTRGIGLEVRGPDDARSTIDAVFGAP
jgi:MerR family copper efflux transcriptional regulator